MPAIFVVIAISVATTAGIKVAAMKAKAGKGGLRLLPRPMPVAEH